MFVIKNSYKTFLLLHSAEERFNNKKKKHCLKKERSELAPKNIS